MCHFTQPSDTSVHIWLGFRSKLDSVKFWFAFGYRKNLDQTASDPLKCTQKEKL